MTNFREKMAAPVYLLRLIFLLLSEALEWVARKIAGDGSEPPAAANSYAKRYNSVLGLVALVVFPAYFWIVAYTMASYTPRDPQTLDPDIIERVGETNAYMVAVTPATFRAGDADTSDHPQQSKLLLYENGVLLGPAHTPHSEISSLGGGRYSHWFGRITVVMFSASDNTDPRTNGRIYRITDPSAGRD